MRFSKIRIPGENLLSINNTYSKIKKSPLLSSSHLSLGFYHKTQPQHELAAATIVSCPQIYL